MLKSTKMLDAEEIGKTNRITFGRTTTKVRHTVSYHGTVEEDAQKNEVSKTSGTKNFKGKRRNTRIRGEALFLAKGGEKPEANKHTRI